MKPEISELNPKEEDLLGLRKKYNRCTLFSLVVIPILIVIYSIFRERDISLIDPEDIIKSLTDKNDYRLIKLKNKVEVLLVHDPKTERSAVSLTVNAGSFYDNTPGLAHFCEHTVFMGTKKYKNRDSFTDEIYKYSGTYNAFTAPDKTTYFYSVENNGLEPTFPVFSSMFEEPLFKKEYIEKEINAINSEHEKNINSDIWIINQILQYQSNSSHPLFNFFTGNKDTLGSNNIPIDKLRNEVSNFFDYFYKGENMKLCLISNMTISDLEKLVNKYFTFDTSKRCQSKKGKDFTDKINGLKNINPFDTSKNSGKIIWYKSSSGENTLNIFFPTSEIISLYKTKPNDYLTYLLMYEGENSLIGYLKRNDYILSLDCGVSDSFKTFSIYEITVTLTDKGVNQYDDVIKLIFKYINLIKSKNINSNYFIDIKNIDDNAFKFQEKSDPYFLGINVTMGMFDYDKEDILYGNYHHSQFKVEAIKNYLKKINIKNSIIILSTEKNLTNTSLLNNSINPIIYSKLPYYDNEYFLNYLPEQFKEQCEKFNKNDNNNFALRNKNNYITKIKNLAVPCYENKNSKCFKNLTENNINNDSDILQNEYYPKIKNYNPILITNKTFFISYYKIDKSFYLPRSNIIIKIGSPKYFISGNVNNEIYINLLINLYKLKISQNLNEALETNNPISISYYAEFMKIEIQCYSDLCEKISNQISNIIINKDNINETDINYCKASFINSIENQNVKLAVRKNKDMFIKVISKNIINYDDLLNHISSINNVNANQFKKFYDDFIKDIELTLLIHGDTSEKQSKKISQIFEDNLKAHKTENPQFFSNKKKMQYDLSYNNKNSNKKMIYNYYFINNFKNENNHATSIYYQIGKYSYKTILYVSLFSKCVKNIYFNELRTEKQYGYIVYSDFFLDGKILYYSVSVQGTVKFPDEIDFEISNTISHALNINCSSNFNELKNNLLNDIMINENNLMERTEFIFKEISSGDLIFNRRKLLAEELNNIKDYNEVKNFMDNSLINEPKRVGIFNYAANKKIGDVENRIYQYANKNYSLNNKYKIVYSNDKSFLKDNAVF